jgi:DNA invertase Pin-like site-specific DNA recombinase
MEGTAVQIYREEGQSAHSESVKKRPMFRQLMEDARKDRFDIVVVHTLDRWSRNHRVTLAWTESTNSTQLGRAR